MIQFKAKDGFDVSKFLTLIEVDFVYSYNPLENKYLLLNQEIFGEMEEDFINQQKETNKIIIININNLNCEAYNVSDAELADALVKMG
ncbi:hypothetical protein JXA27_06820 [Aerococcaceae bacterium zg-B36]|uniref:hypothetical protein n=1 Tax=Aerococcaceae bacterium zg-252 TaxID=2796928 RepID=UPI001BD8FE96|nr:hypothetical protein [Aerococcaceae bacterium zg-B36]